VSVHEPGGTRRDHRVVAERVYRHGPGGRLPAGAGALRVHHPRLLCRYRRAGHRDRAHVPVDAGPPGARPQGAFGQRLSYEQLQAIDFYVLGNPATVTRKLTQLVERLNPGYLLVYGNEGDMAHKDVMRSIELLGKEVLPALHAIQLHPYE